MIDELVAAWFRATDRLRDTRIGAVVGRGLRLHPPAPVERGFYLAEATRFEVGRLRNLMLAHRTRNTRSLSGTLERWRRFPEAYLILKRAEGGRVVDSFLGGGVLMALYDVPGAALLAGTRNWTSIGVQELRAPPTNYIYAQFAEAPEKRHRAALMRELCLRAGEMGAADCWLIARPVTQAALHFYRSRGFTGTDGSSPELNEVCATQPDRNPRMRAAVRGRRSSGIQDSDRQVEG
ncbi:MAG: hypothetical protein ABL879_14290 [Devosia sp.]